VYCSVGCEQCGERGYKGRVALMEIFRLDDTLQDMIAHRIATYEIKKYAKSMGFRTIAQDGIRRVVDGTTSAGGRKYPDHFTRCLEINFQAKSSSRLKPTNKLNLVTFR